MALRQRIPRPTHPDTTDLEQRLTEELRSPKPEGQPEIIIEGDGIQSAFHLYVIWDDWTDMEQIDRSGIVLRAFEAVRGKAASLKVTVAMGLTTEEARRMGIYFE